MSISLKDAGVWKDGAPWVKDAGVWKPVQNGFVKDAGVWKEFYTAYTQPTFRSSAYTVDAAFNNRVNAAKPTGVAEGDLLIAFVTAPANVTISSPAGWSNEASTSINNVSSLISTKIASASESSTYEFNRSSNGSLECVILAYTPGESLIDVAGAIENQNLSSSPGIITAPSVTTTREALLLGFFTARNSGFTVSSPPSGMTERFSNGVDGFRRVIFDQSVGVGSTGTRSVTWNSTFVISTASLLAIY